jgi:branched-chain amino acid aminotransferase
LGFGQYFASQMVTMGWTEKGGWGASQVGPMAPIPLHPSASVLQYSQTIFEGMKAFWGVDGKVRVFRPAFNAERFRRSAERICLPPVEIHAFMEQVDQAVKANFSEIPRGPGESLYIRPTLIATEGFLGVRPSKAALFYIICSPVGAYFSNSAGLRILIETQDSRAARGGVGFAKTGANYAASLRAAEHAKAQGYDQVLWTDSTTHEWVEEVGTMNIMFVLKDRVVTPPLKDTILNGSIRSVALQLLQDWQIPVVEEDVSIETLKSWHKDGLLVGAFGTGTAAVISPVQTFGCPRRGIELKIAEESPLVGKLRKHIMDIQWGRAPDPHNWCHVVSI